MECHKHINGYSVRVKVWHTDNHEDGSAVVQVHESYTYMGSICSREAVPAEIAARFDKFADSCYWDYIEELELEEDKVILDTKVSDEGEA